MGISNSQLTCFSCITIGGSRGCTRHMPPPMGPNSFIFAYISVADPGFSIGGVLSCLGGANLQHVCFSVKTDAKTKELDLVGGCMLGVPPGSANAFSVKSTHVGGPCPPNGSTPPLWEILDPPLITGHKIDWEVIIEVYTNNFQHYIHLTMFSMSTIEVKKW